MGDYKSYNFTIKTADIVNHNFFLFLNQTIVPRKCLQVIDSETADIKRNFKIQIDENFGE